MQPSDKTSFVKLLMGLSATKPGVKLTDESYEIYWLSLQDWPFEEFKQAAVHLAKQSEFMPNPYHFEQLRKAGRPTAGEEWAKVLRFARSGYSPHVNYQRKPPPGFSDATLRAVEAVGGFRAIANGNSDATHFVEKTFAKNLKDIRDVSDTREAVPQIAYEASNAPQLTGPSVAERPAAVDVLVKRLSAATAPVKPETPAPAPTRRLAATRQRNAKTPAELESDARKLAAAGLGGADIARMLGQHGVTEQRVQQWLAVGEPA